MATKRDNIQALVIAAIALQAVNAAHNALALIGNHLDHDPDGLAAYLVATTSTLLLVTTELNKYTARLQKALGAE